MALKHKVSEIGSLFENMAECIDYIYKGFSTGDLTVLDKADCLMEDMQVRVTYLTEAIVSEGRADKEARRYVSVPSHFARIHDGIVRIARGVRRTALEDIPFSDKGTDEIGYMFERLRDIAVHLKELLESRSPLAARHIVGSEEVVERSAAEFATKHEERLIEGLCMPKASSIYLEMMDSFKNIAFHAREIARDLAG